jgi:hypothetical protein
VVGGPTVGGVVVGTVGEFGGTPGAPPGGVTGAMIGVVVEVSVPPGPPPRPPRPPRPPPGGSIWYETQRESDENAAPVALGISMSRFVSRLRIWSTGFASAGVVFVKRSP